MDMDSSGKPLLVAFGNPLLDLCVLLPDDSILQQFGLADDSAREVTAAEYESLIKAVNRFPHTVSPGGAALNSLRVFQWLWGRPKCTAFLGTIGVDEFGKCLTDLVEDSGVSTRFIKHSTLPTGAAISLIHGKTRTLVAHIGASSVYDMEDFHEEDLLKTTCMVFIENFFFSHSIDFTWEIVKMCKMNAVAIAFNLSGAYLFGEKDKEITTLASYANVLIGNESEFQALSKALNWDIKNVLELAQKISDAGVHYPPGITTAKPLKMINLTACGKIVVITRGHLPVVCASQNGAQVFEIPVFCPDGGVKDTTGAGDAFVAGFFKGLFQDLMLQQCVYLGCYASAEIIQQVGCIIPNHNPLEFAQVEDHYKLYHDVLVENH